MTQAPTINPTQDPAADPAELLKLGITRVPADNFLWNGYRYTNVRDAIAAAKRGDPQ